MVESLKHRLVGGDPLLSRSVSVGLPEGTLAQDLGGLQDRFPEVEIGSYPYQRDGRFGVRLVLRATDSRQLDQVAKDLDAIILKLGGEGEWDPPR
jgi:molybdopterin-biosynthesis enzyme MoeA-like protein